MKRIYIVGVSGAGKSTLGRKISTKLSIPFYELDAVFLEQERKAHNQADKLEKISQLAQLDSWVIEGGYALGKEIFTSEADTLIILDYSKSRIFFQLFKRYLAASAKSLGSQQKISFRSALKTSAKFFTKLWRLIFNFKNKSSEKRSAAAGRSNSEIVRLRFRNPRETAAWLESLPS